MKPLRGFGFGWFATHRRRLGSLGRANFSVPIIHVHPWLKQFAKRLSMWHYFVIVMPIFAKL
jgi:hypothetical protein